MGGGRRAAGMFATIAHFNFGEHSPAHRFRKDVGARAEVVGVEGYGRPG